MPRSTRCPVWIVCALTMATLLSQHDMLRFSYQKNMERILVQVGKGPVEWIHVPKTGTGLAHLLLAAFCPTEKVNVTLSSIAGLSPECRKHFVNSTMSYRNDRLPLADHFSLNAESESELKRVYVVIRAPWNRITSGYHYTRFMRKNDKNQSASEEENICRVSKTSKVPHIVRGAQVKMLMGHKMSSPNAFHDPSPPSWEETIRACNKLSSMSFVGVTDFWNTSACVFGQIHGIAWEHFNIHMRAGKYSGIRTDCGDIWDDYLYRCALDHLISQLRSYPGCLSYFVQEVWTKQKQNELSYAIL